MPRRKRTHAVIAGARESRSIAAALGGQLRATRLRRRLTQAALGRRVGLGQSEISHLERGNGAGTSIATWVAIGIALDRPVAVAFSREVIAPLNDAGHLAAQEMLIRLARAAGWRAAVETPSDPRSPAHSSDVELGDRSSTLVLVEIWNRLDDLGAAARSSDRKVADVGGRNAAQPASCWLLVDTAANRAIVRQFPSIIRARFPASSTAWVRALTIGGPAPRRPGIAWIDVRSGRLRPMRLGAA